jgi:hypothetical protein
MAEADALTRTLPFKLHHYFEFPQVETAKFGLTESAYAK